MVKSPLGTDERIWKSNLHERKKNKYYRRGLKAALKGETEKDNPYILSPDMLQLLRKRTYWILGFSDADYGDKLRHRRKKENAKEVKKMEKALTKKIKTVKDKKDKKKHGKHKHRCRS